VPIMVSTSSGTHLVMIALDAPRLLGSLESEFVNSGLEFAHGDDVLQVFPGLGAARIADRYQVKQKRRSEGIVSLFAILISACRGPWTCSRRCDDELVEPDEDG